MHVVLSLDTVVSLQVAEVQVQVHVHVALGWKWGSEPTDMSGNRDKEVEGGMLNNENICF